MGLVMSSVKEVLSSYNAGYKVDEEEDVFIIDHEMLGNNYQVIQHPPGIEQWRPAEIREEHETSCTKRVSCYFCANTPPESFVKNDEYFLKRDRRSKSTLQLDCLVEKLPSSSTDNLATFKENDANTVDEDVKSSKSLSVRDNPDAPVKGLNTILSLPNLGKPILKPRVSEKMETVIKQLKILNKQRKASSVNCKVKSVNDFSNKLYSTSCATVNDNPSTVFKYEENKNNLQINQPVKTMNMKEPSENEKSYRQILDKWHYVDEKSTNAKRTYV